MKNSRKDLHVYTPDGYNDNILVSVWEDKCIHSSNPNGYYNSKVFGSDRLRVKRKSQAMLPSLVEKMHYCDPCLADKLDK